MVQMVKQAVEEGAVGFSTSIPSALGARRAHSKTWADLRETKAMQEAVVEAGAQVGYTNPLTIWRRASKLNCKCSETAPNGLSGALLWWCWPPRRWRRISVERLMGEQRGRQTIGKHMSYSSKRCFLWSKQLFLLSERANHGKS